MRPRPSIATGWSTAMGGAEAREKIAAEIAASQAGGRARCGSGRVPHGRRTATNLSRVRGEIIGLAGLAGHGQTDLLLAIFAAASRARAGIEVTAPVALVAGDRQSDGIFPQWSIAREHRHPLAGALAQRPADLAAARGRARRILAEEDRHPHARHEQQHLFAVRRQPAEGAVCPGARLRCRRSC